MEKRNQILIIVRGIPGSGKSTFAKEIVKMFPDDSVYWESDMFFMHNGVYCWKPNKVHLAHRWCQQKVEKSFDAVDIVVVSNTFTTESEMKFYLDFAKENGISVQIVRMEKIENSDEILYGCKFIGMSPGDQFKIDVYQIVSEN